MSKPNARKRQRADALRAEQARLRAARERRQRRLMIFGPIVVVVAIVAAMVGVKVLGGDPTPPPVSDPATQAATIARLTSLPAATLETAGAPGKAVLTPIKGQQPLTDQGKPKVLYVGAEFCPYCASQRWPLIVALSRFGTFTGLAESHSSSSDVFPDTSTLTFKDAAYTSTFLSFTPVETADAEGNRLQSPTPADDAVFKKFNAPPYVDKDSQGSIPFIDFGNRFLTSGASVSPELFKGLDHATVVARLTDPSSDLGRQAGAAANAITAGLCSLTGDKPAEVCTGKVVAGLKGALDAGR
ncbi:MAG: DUF929 family protein [Streptosporangiaceae bacterium]